MGCLWVWLEVDLELVCSPSDSQLSVLIIDQSLLFHLCFLSTESQGALVFINVQLGLYLGLFLIKEIDWDDAVWVQGIWLSFSYVRALLISVIKSMFLRKTHGSPPHRFINIFLFPSKPSLKTTLLLQTFFLISINSEPVFLKARIPKLHVEWHEVNLVFLHVRSCLRHMLFCCVTEITTGTLCKMSKTHPSRHCC